MSHYNKPRGEEGGGDRKKRENEKAQKQANKNKYHGSDTRDDETPGLEAAAENLPTTSKSP